MARDFHVLSSVVLFFLLSIGCASNKPLLRGNATGNANEAHALKAFGEGMAQLYTNNRSAYGSFLRAAELYDHLIPAYRGAGLAAEAMHLWKAAAESYEACLLKKMDHTDCYYGLLMVRLAQGRVEEAEEMVADGLRRFSQKAFPRVLASELALAKGQFDKAQALARAAMDIEPSGETWSVMARIFSEQQRYPAAIDAAKKAIELTPSDGRPYLLLGHALLANGQEGEALGAYATAVKLMPTDEALERHALLAIRMNRRDEARASLKRLQEREPNDFRHSLLLGETYMVDAMFDEARESYLRAERLAPLEPSILYDFGMLYFSLRTKQVQDLKKAKRYFMAFLDRAMPDEMIKKDIEAYLRDIDQKIFDRDQNSPLETDG